MGRKTKEEEQKLLAMANAIEKKKGAEDAPATVSFGMIKEPGTGWIFTTYHIKNGKVINEEHKECMDKNHAIETFKLAFVLRFIDGK